MFIGKMVTEAIPIRVFSLCKIIGSSKKKLTKLEVKDLMEPKELNTSDTQYFYEVLKAAEELKLLEITDNYIELLVDFNSIKTIESFRGYVIDKLNFLQQSHFYNVSKAIINMNEDILMKEYKLSDAPMINYITEKIKEDINANEMRGWRFWASFIGLGYEYNSSFLPNGYTYVKEVIKLMNLEENVEYPIDDFMNNFAKKGSIITNYDESNKQLNLAFSNALRQLQDSGEIELKHVSDQLSNYVLYPTNELYNLPVSAIVCKGVK